MSNPNSGSTKAPDFAKQYKEGLKTYLDFLPKELQNELQYRQQYDPQFIEQQMGIQDKYDPHLAQEQLMALARRDPQWLGVHEALGGKVADALQRGYVDPRQEAAYAQLAASAGKGEPTRDQAYQALGQQVTGDTLRGTTADPTTLKQMTQAILSRQPSLSYGEAQNMAAAVYTGQRGQALQQQRQQATGQFLQTATPTAQREQSLANFYGQTSPEQNAMALAGTYIQPSNSITGQLNQIPGVQAPRSFGYVNPNAGYQGVQFGLQNFQNQLASQQGGGGGGNPWTNALQGAATGAQYGSIGGGYGAAGGAVTGATAGLFGYPQYSTILLKTDVKKVGEHNGLDIVEFRYKGRQVHYRGVIAEQVKEKFPDAVGARNGYLTVDYDKIGVVMERQCNDCKCFKPLTDFPRASNGAAGRRSRCLECHRVYDRKLIDPRREEHLEYHRNWNRQNKERHQVLNIMSKFKCTHAEALRLYTIRKISESCAICGESPSKRGLFIDHCHSTGKIRGLLCHNCNAGIGNFKDDPLKLQKAMVYLLKYFEEEEEVTPAKNNGSRTRPVEQEVQNG